VVGVGNSVGSVIYFNTVGIEEVSGVQIGAQTFNNVKCIKINSIWTSINDEDDFITLWMAQDTQGNLWLMKVHNFFDDTTIVLGGTDLKSMFMPAISEVGDQPKILLFSSRCEGKPLTYETIRSVYEKAKKKAAVKGGEGVCTFRHHADSRIMPNDRNKSEALLTPLQFKSA